MSNLQPNLSKTINFSEFQNDFFSEFNQWDEMKYLLLFFHTMISFIAPVLMFSIIWYENNGCAAHYRTVINILLCNTCIINTLRGFVTRVPHAIMIIFSPMSMTFCDGIFTTGRFFFSCIVTEIWLWQITKYFYIFHWKRRAEIDDNFIATFATMANLPLNECLSSPNRLYDWISKCRD